MRCQSRIRVWELRHQQAGHTRLLNPVRVAPIPASTQISPPNQIPWLLRGVNGQVDLHPSNQEDPEANWADIWNELQLDLQQGSYATAPNPGESLQEFSYSLWDAL